MEVLLSSVPFLDLAELLKEGAQLLSAVEYEGYLTNDTGSVEVRFGFDKSDGEVQRFEFLCRVLECFGRAHGQP